MPTTELLALARDCLAAEARDRPADAGVVAERMTAYLAGVQERLREAELSRAAESARAQEAEAKASAERRARRLTAALAATVLLAGVLGGAGWRWVELQRLERVREASGRVNVALQDATRLRGLAQGAAVGDLGPWELAAVAAEKARDLLEPGVEPALRKQVEDLAAELAVERQQAEAAAQAAERDRTLLDRLVDIRSAEADDRGGWSTDAAYADAFREAGLDVAALPAEEAAKRIRDRPPAVATALATAVDDWAAIRRDRQKNRAGAAALSALAAAADPDTWRLGLRRALDLPDRAARLEALRRLAKAAPFETLGPVSLDLLGRALKDAGDPAGAEVGAAAGPAAPPRRRVDQLRPGPFAGEAGPAGGGDPLLHGGPVAPPRDGPRAGPCAGGQGRGGRSGSSWPWRCGSGARRTDPASTSTRPSPGRRRTISRMPIGSRSARGRRPLGPAQPERRAAAGFAHRPVRKRTLRHTLFIGAGRLCGPEIST